MSATRRWLRAACEPRTDGWADPLYAAALGAIYVALLLGTVGNLGYARDEGFYFEAARAYQAWFELLWNDSGRALAEVDAYWRWNHEHPALVKSLFALSHLFFWDKVRLFSMEGTSFRFPAMVLSGLAVSIVFLWGARARGRLAGLVAAGSLGFMPHFFFHAHLACFDAPVVATWTLCAYAWWRAIDKGGWVRALLVGLAFGAALNTKHNSWFLPIVCSAHALVLLLPGATPGIEKKRALARAAMSLGAMATIGPFLFWASWPWIWNDTIARFREYAMFHLGHVYYNMEFLGRNYWRPPMPRSYAFVMTVATVPLVTLLSFALGLAVAVRREALAIWSAIQRSTPRRPFLPKSDPATTWLWLIAMTVQYAAWLRSSTPIFGGTKHWMTAYPFLALFAAEGVRALLLMARHRWLRRPFRPLVRGRALEIAFGIAAVLPPVAQALHAHPWGLSFYNALVGGAPGAA
ncbi:MAG TPA: glycosyltransferase family 39 protein, partial [Polyangiaceae bacterium]|nr:glycosyltransferase family 39 protein [Polyangiaceae bacterium]